MRTDVHRDKSSPPNPENASKIQFASQSLDNFSEIRSCNELIIKSLYSKPVEHWSIRVFSILGPIVLGILAMLFLLSVS